MSDPSLNLPAGVFLRPIDRHADRRGAFAEMYRAEWFPELPPVQQYQLLYNGPDVLRGFHVHAVHHDYLSVVSGSFILGLRDMRPWSPTHGLAQLLVMTADEPASIQIPPGVGHGFYFDEECTLLLGVSHYWHTDDELACRWDDEDLGLDWGVPGDREPQLSERDRTAGSYAEMQRLLLSRMQ